MNAICDSPFAMGAHGYIMIEGSGATPHLDDFAIRGRRRGFFGQEAAEAGTCVDELGEVRLIEVYGALPVLLSCRGQDL